MAVCFFKEREINEDEKIHRGGVTLIASLLTLTCAPTASADDTDLVTNDTAALIAEVAPEAGGVVIPDTSTTGMSAEVADVSVTVPTDPAESITIASTNTDRTQATLGAPVVHVSLPPEINVHKGHVAKDGTIVYQMSAKHGAHSAVQVLDDGSVCFETVMDSAQSPHRFTYSFAGATPVLQADGSVTLVQTLRGSAGFIQATVGHIEAAWAVDASGRAVKTSYQVTGRGLVQVVTTDKHTVFPVVADPKVSLSWSGLLIQFNRSETNKVSWGGAVATGVLAALVGVPLAGAFVALVYGGGSAYAGYVYGQGKCLSATFNGFMWYLGSYTGGYCK